MSGAFGGDGGIAGRKIWVFANIDWSAPWQPIHEITTRLARANDVTFIETTGRRRPTLRDISRLSRRLRRRPRAPAAPGIRVVSPRVLPLPSSRVAARINARLLRRRLGAADGVVVWAYLPSPTLLALLDGSEPAALIYHCMLDFPALAGAPEGVAEVERKLVRRADLTVVDSKNLLAARGWSRPAAVHIRSGAAVEAFDAGRLDSLAVAPDVAALPRPVAGFAGTIDERLDVELLREAAKLAPAWSFALVGPSSRRLRRALASSPNVHILPPRPHRELPNVVAGFDVCLLPYADHPMRRTTLPAKLFECLASGRPLIATPLPELDPEADLVTFVRTASELAAALAHALAEGPRRAERRVAVARANGWEEREREWGRALRNRRVSTQARTRVPPCRGRETRFAVMGVRLLAPLEVEVVSAAARAWVGRVGDRQPVGTRDSSQPPPLRKNALPGLHNEASERPAPAGLS